MSLKGLKQKYTQLKSGGYALYISHRDEGAIATYHGSTPEECYQNMQDDSLNLAQIWLDIFQPKPNKTTLSGLITSWLMTPAFEPVLEGQPPKKGQYSITTQKQWRKYASMIRTDLGHWTRRDIEKPTATAALIDYRDKFRENARKADYIIQVLQACLKWAKLRGYIASNPCNDIPKIYESDRSEIVWEKEEIELLCLHANEYAARAFLFLILTGLRRGDAITASWNDIQGNYLIRKTSKSRKKKSANILITPELRNLLNSCPKVASTILVSSKGLPWSGGGLRQAFDRAKIAAGITADKRIHDMRGTSATDAVINEILQTPEFKEKFGWTEKGTSAPRRYVAIENVLKTKFGGMSGE